MCFVREEQVLMGKLGGHEVRIAMAGPKAKVSVHCNRLAEGKLSVRDLNRNISLLVSNARPDCLAQFTQQMKQALGKPKTPPKAKPPSPTSPWSRAQKRRALASCINVGHADRHGGPRGAGAQDPVGGGTAPPGGAEEGGGAAERVVLSREQEAVVELALEGSSFFLTGGAGTGKSVVLREIIRRCVCACVGVCVCVYLSR